MSAMAINGEEISPAGAEQERSEQGASLAAISRRIVGLLKESYGKGPAQARTYYSGDLVVVLLNGGYTTAERTLIEDGRSRAVMDLRAEMQEAMNDRFRQVIEEELHREVVAFMSAAHHDPDYNAEVFVLASQKGDEASVRTTGSEDEPQYAAED
jgi:uncharacterized protein YbcI